MADYLFVPQSVLDRWSEQGKITVEDTVLTILGEGKAFALTAAVRFLKMEAGDDVAGLLQKVKTTAALKQLGAEHYLESVILGDSAYEVQQGFLADANALRRAAAASNPALPAAQTPVAEEPSRTEGEAARVPTPAGAPEGASPIPADLGRPPAAQPDADAASGAPRPNKPAGAEQDLLAQFLLDNLQ
jgi:hypothetical protein